MMSNDGHAVHNPITLVKPIDKSTPLLAMALDKQEKVKVLIDFLPHHATCQTREVFLD
ncbi:type VI secretion system tube protein Hcp [Brenneria alni]|uniref:type VI secretion system tube protein Hcp n=1 Tax=Brenneria alni TaxID=71656 RepID=UPI0023E831B8|nr:type VI secretion system tube protein Hcp [Brenneria alni]